MKKRCNVMLDEDVWQKLALLAAVDGLSLSGELEKAAAEYLAKDENAAYLRGAMKLAQARNGEAGQKNEAKKARQPKKPAGGVVKRVKFTDEDKAQALALREEGKGYKEIAEDMGRSPHTIRDFLRRHDKQQA